MSPHEEKADSLLGGTAPGMQDGPPSTSKYLSMDAEISACGQYRYSLTRRFSPGDRTVVFVGLNPSTADARVDDATIRKCVGFVRRWGADRLVMANVCAWRSRHPKEMQRADDPVGPENEGRLRDLVASAEIVVAAWGQNKLPFRAQRLARWVLGLPNAYCLGTNADGTPRHPLFVPYDTPLQAAVVDGGAQGDA